MTGIKNNFLSLIYLYLKSCLITVRDQATFHEKLGWLLKKPNSSDSAILSKSFSESPLQIS